jgi:hypothetical protein
MSLKADLYYAKKMAELKELVLKGLLSLVHSSNVYTLSSELKELSWLMELGKIFYGELDINFVYHYALLALKAVIESKTGIKTFQDRPFSFLQPRPSIKETVKLREEICLALLRGQVRSIVSEWAIPEKGEEWKHFPNFVSKRDRPCHQSRKKVKTITQVDNPALTLIKLEEELAQLIEQSRYETDQRTRGVQLKFVVVHAKGGLKYAINKHVKKGTWVSAKRRESLLVRPKALKLFLARCARVRAELLDLSSKPPTGSTSVKRPALREPQPAKRSQLESKGVTSKKCYHEQGDPVYASPVEDIENNDCWAAGVVMSRKFVGERASGDTYTYKIKFKNGTVKNGVKEVYIKIPKDYRWFDVHDADDLKGVTHYCYMTSEEQYMKI